MDKLLSAMTMFGRKLVDWVGGSGAIGVGAAIGIGAAIGPVGSVAVLMPVFIAGATGSIIELLLSELGHATAAAKKKRR